MLNRVDCIEAANHETGQHSLQISAGTERLVTRPDDHTAVISLSQLDATQQAFRNLRADRVHFCFDAGDQYIAVCRMRPQAYGTVLKDCLTRAFVSYRAVAEERLGEQLTRMHG